MKVQTKSDNSRSEIQIEHKWGVEEIADCANADTVAVPEALDTQPEVSVKVNLLILMKCLCLTITKHQQLFLKSLLIGF